MKTTYKPILVAVLALVVVLAVLVIAACQTPPAPEQDDLAAAFGGYNADCYQEQNTGEIVCESNDDITIASAYPILAASSGQIVYCNVTSGVVQAATVIPTSVAALATVTWAGCEPGSGGQVFAGAWDCGVAIHSTNRMTMTLYEVDATPVPTAAYQKIRYCIVGNK